MPYVEMVLRGKNLVGGDPCGSSRLVIIRSEIRPSPSLNDSPVYCIREVTAVKPQFHVGEELSARRRTTHERNSHNMTEIPTSIPIP